MTITDFSIFLNHGGILHSLSPATTRRGHPERDILTPFNEEHMGTVPDTQGTYTELEDMLHKYLDTYHPHIPMGLHSRCKPPWWDTCCNRVIAERRRAYHAYRRDNTLETYLEAKRTEARTKRHISKVKRLYWITFCAQINPDTPTTKIWKQVAWFKRSKSISTPPNIQGNPTLQEEFLASLTPAAMISAPPAVIAEEPLLYTSGLNAPITTEEIRGVSGKHARKSAPGADEITYSLLRLLPTVWWERILPF